MFKLLCSDNAAQLQTNGVGKRLEVLSKRHLTNQLLIDLRHRQQPAQSHQTTHSALSSATSGQLCIFAQIHQSSTSHRRGFSGYSNGHSQ